MYTKYGPETFKKTTIDVEARAEGKCLWMPYRSAPFVVIRRCLLQPVRLLHAISTRVLWGCTAAIQALEPDALQPDAAISASESSNRGNCSGEKEREAHYQRTMYRRNGTGMAPGWEWSLVYACVEWERTRRNSE